MDAKRFSLPIVLACLCLSVAEQASAYYAANMGRWTTRDPKGEIGRNGMDVPPDAEVAMGFVDRDHFDPMAAYDGGMNLYQYVDSSPVLLTDPSGLLAPAPIPIPIPAPIAPVVATPIGGALAACVVGPCVGYKVGQCTTGPLTQKFFDWYYKPCPPCPEPPKPQVHKDHDHYPCLKDTGSMTHWHYFTYNQNPDTCKCYLQRHFGGCGEPKF
jgi:hypothetical protein